MFSLPHPSTSFVCRIEPNFTSSQIVMVVVFVFFWFALRLSQRVAMDDLASYFVEERSKVR